MPGSWLPTNSEEMFRWYDRQIRMLTRHRHTQNLGEIADAIDASGGQDLVGLDEWTEGVDEFYPLPQAPLAGAEVPSGSESSPISGLDTVDSSPLLGTIAGATRAEVVATVMTDFGGSTILQPSEWFMSDLYGTSGANVSPDASHPYQLLVNVGGWFSVTGSWTMQWSSTQANTIFVLTWSGLDAGYAPTDQHHSVAGPERYSLHAGPIWLPTNSWIAPYGYWTSSADATDGYGALDIVRYG